MQSASTNQGQLHYDMMSLDVIELDPNNPRKLSVSPQEIKNGIHSSDSNYKKKSKDLDALHELAESIKRVGIRNAIEVYKDGNKYFVITGERRYWAAVLAGHKTIPVRIHQKPDEFNLRYIQWVENINRQDLSLWERFHNLRLLADTHKNTNQNELTEEFIKKILGVSNTQAYRYCCLLKADNKTLDLIQSGKLNNLKIVQELVCMKDRVAKSQMITWIASSKEEVTSLSHYREVAGKKSMKQINNTQSISLGRLDNIDVAKQLLEIVISDIRLQKYRDQFNHIDWSSSKSIAKGFKNLFKALKVELSTKETF
jgi:ParB family chromosome partitioning protein